LTCPLTVATVAGSIGVAAGAGAASFSAIVLVDCSVFLLHAAVNAKAPKAKTPAEIILQFAFLFMMSFFLFVSSWSKFT
jgi:hypothetical protein